MKRLVILGSTGTVGQNALEVARKGQDRFDVIGLACRGSKDLLGKQIREFSPGYAYIEEPDPDFEKKFPATKFFYGDSGMAALSSVRDADIILCAVPGINTLKAVIAAVERGKTIGLATKEILVAAGDIVMSLAEKHGALLLPVDSEHNAVFQALEGVRKDEIRKIYLTASGGPFFGRPPGEDVSAEEVLNHPVWKMGRKITVDSATMMNKAFEIIEAHHLFGLSSDRIDVLIHPEALIHGMAELNDGTIKAVFSEPDMKFPISFVLDYPERKMTSWTRIDFSRFSSLSLYPADRDSLWFSMAADAIKRGGAFPVAMNAANEAAVDLFLGGYIKFGDILGLVKQVVYSDWSEQAMTVDLIIDIDIKAKAKTRQMADEMIKAGDKKTK